MKKIILIVLVISTQISKAQWSTTGGLNTSTLSTGGSVGIGLSSPGAPLDVRSSSPTNFSTIAKFSRNGASGFGMGIFHGLSQGNYNGIVGNGDFGLIFDVDGQPTTISNSGFVIAPWQNNTAGIKILENGKVFIGNVTTTPGNYSLYVEKGILTEMVRVALKNSAQWADYVFHKDYKLKSLKEVEDFIQENNHLPNVPSSEEIVKDGGIDVSSMMAKQMEKIEELTLYIIEQNKKLEKLQAQVNKLQNN